jgi:hypothetical protein
MTNTFNPTGNQEKAIVIQPNDVKALIQKHGKTIVGNQEFTLKTPQLTDSKLLAIVSNPSFSVKPLKSAPDHAEFELTAAGQSVTISVAAKTIGR